MSSELDGSYSQPVSTVTATVNDIVTTTNAQIAPSSSNDAILSLLQDMNKSNQDIVRRIDALEHQQSANSSPIVMRSQSGVHSHLPSFPTNSVSDLTQGYQVGFKSLQTTAKDTREPRDPITTEYNSSASHQPSITAIDTLQHQDCHCDTFKVSHNKKLM